MYRMHSIGHNCIKEKCNEQGELWLISCFQLESFSMVAVIIAQLFVHVDDDTGQIAFIFTLCNLSHMLEFSLTDTVRLEHTPFWACTTLRNEKCDAHGPDASVCHGMIVLYSTSLASFPGLEYLQFVIPYKVNVHITHETVQVRQRFIINRTVNKVSSTIK